MTMPLFKVVVCRPDTRPAPAPAELRRRDFCWGSDGEILAPPALPCADRETCGCAWSFAGVTSARATSWGVVETRTMAQITAAIVEGQHLAGWVKDVADFDTILRDDILDISKRVQALPVGALVGIWSLDEGVFGIYERGRLQTSLSGRAARPSR